MHWLDIVIIVGSGILGFIGYRMGMLKLLALVVGVALGIVMGSRFNGEVADILSRWIDSEGTAKILAYAIILVLAIFVASIIAGLLRRVLKVLLLGWVDRLVGLALGVLAAFAIFSALLSFAQELSLLGLVGADIIEASSLGSFLASKFDIVLKATKLVPGDLGLN